MPMPKGYKKETGYGSTKVLGGKSYHDIAKHMNENNYKMNHSTVRNIYITGLIKIADSLTKLQSNKFDKKKLKEIAIDPRFQEAIAEYIREIEYEKKS